jgi:hypothetical protein
MWVVVSIINAAMGKKKPHSILGEKYNEQIKRI